MRRGLKEPLVNPHLVLVSSTHLVLLFVEGHCDGDLDIILLLHLALLGTGLGCRDLGLTRQCTLEVLYGEIGGSGGGGGGTLGLLRCACCLRRPTTKVGKRRKGRS